MQDNDQNTTPPESGDDLEAMMAGALGDDYQGVESENETFDTNPSIEDVPEGHRSGYVTVIGRPNVGKSTLVNAILNEKIAIVSPRPQTTRLRQLGIYSTPETQIVFVDTPGVHQPRNVLGDFMYETALRALMDADIILFMTDVSQSVKDEDRNVADLIKAADETPVIHVLNKVDQAADPETHQLNTHAHRELIPDAPWTTTIATERTGLVELVQMIYDRLPEGPRYFPPEQISDVRMRDIAAEMVREAALYVTEQEIPYSIAVVVDEYKERENGVVYIAASVYVERDSQKAIVIGKKGQKIKTISTRARHEIEKFLGTRIYLELRVRIMKNWRKDENALRRLGYRLR